MPFLKFSKIQLILWLTLIAVGHLRPTRLHMPILILGLFQVITEGPCEIQKPPSSLQQPLEVLCGPEDQPAFLEDANRLKWRMMAAMQLLWIVGGLSEHLFFSTFYLSPKTISCKFTTNSCTQFCTKFSKKSKVIFG